MRRANTDRDIIFRRLPRMTVREVATSRPVWRPRSGSLSLRPLIPVQFPWAYQKPDRVITNWFKPRLPLHPFSW